MEASAAALTVAQLSEEELLAAFTPLLSPSPNATVGNGDDCAVLRSADGQLCVSTDVLVQNRHFRTDWSSPYDIGRRAAAQNLADAAAMGAVPVALTVGLVLPAQTPVSWVKELARGLAAECATVGAGVVGGDLSGGDEIVIAVTVYGDCQGRRPVLRSGARPGDRLVHVGDCGRSAAGYALRAARISPDRRIAGTSPDRRASGTTGDLPLPEDATTDASSPLAEVTRWCIEGFTCPQPPLASGPALAAAGATALMDVSDSLTRDAQRLASASGVDICLDTSSPALRHSVDRLLPVAHLLGHGHEQAVTWVLTGGEDHGLLATLPPDCALPPGVQIIGSVTPAQDPQHPAVSWDGDAPQAWGWDHFARP